MTKSGRKGKLRREGTVRSKRNVVRREGNHHEGRETLEREKLPG